MTEQEQFFQDVTTAQKNQRNGANAIAYMYALNSSKLRAMTITEPDMDAILAHPGLVIIERFLFNGAMERAKALILADTSGYYSTQEKNDIINVIETELYS